MMMMSLTGIKKTINAERQDNAAEEAQNLELDCLCLSPRSFNCDVILKTIYIELQFPHL